MSNNIFETLLSALGAMVVGEDWDEVEDFLNRVPDPVRLTRTLCSREDLNLSDEQADRLAYAVPEEKLDPWRKCDCGSGHPWPACLRFTDRCL